MAGIQTRIAPFSGNDNESLTKFVASIKQACRVSALNDNVRIDFLALYLSGAALNTFHAMAPATQANFDEAVRVLKDVYEGPNKIEKFKLKFQERKFQKDEMPNALLTDLQNLAALAYPDEPEAEAGEDAPQVDARNARNLRQQIVEASRTSRIKETFVRAMPAQYREKLMHKQDRMTVQQLCDMVEKSMSIKSSCYKDEGDVFYNVDTPSTSCETTETSQMTMLTQMLGSLTQRLVDLESRQSKDEEQADSINRQRERSRERRYEDNRRPRDHSSGERSNVRCYNCNDTGHYATNCKTRSNAKNQQTRIKGDCYNCGKTGHMKRDCRAPLKEQKTQEQKKPQDQKN